LGVWGGFPLSGFWGLVLGGGGWGREVWFDEHTSVYVDSV